MNKYKKISASAMAFVLVLCVGYFAVMSPTSAWFYESGVIDSQNSFVFGDVSVNTEFVSKGSSEFDGATKFFDPDEILFDEVIKTDSIKVTNAGTVPSRIYVGVKNNGISQGLHWFAYTNDELVEGSVKKTIAATLNEMTYIALDDYNVGADLNSGHYVLLNPGESTIMNVATWIEYDAVSQKLEMGRTLQGYDIEITMYATQDKDGALKR